MYRKSGFITVDNARIYYEAAGSGEPVLFVHGDKLDMRMWDAQFDLFSKGYLTLRLDLRGFGKADKPDGSAFRHADDIAALLDQLNIDMVHIVGHSMGGGIAVDFSVEYPERVRGLVVVSPLLSPLSDERLGEVKATTLVLVGQLDTLLHQTVADKIRANIPRNMKFTLPNVGQLPNMEDPETFNTVVHSFLMEVGCGCAGG